MRDELTIYVCPECHRERLYRPGWRGTPTCPCNGGGWAYDKANATPMRAVKYRATEGSGKDD